MTKRNLRYSGLGLAVLTVGAIAACSSDNNTPGGTAGGGNGTAGGHSTAGAGGASATAGATGTTAGATGTTAGAPGTAGGTGTAGAGGASTGFACANTMPTAALITDFSNLMPSTTSTGNYTFMGGVLGGTYTYPANALTIDTVTNTVLNIKGNVHDYDGFGLYFNTCYNAKTPGYTGISFSIKGNAGPTGKIGFRIQTNANTASNDPVNAAAMKGTCVAMSPSNTYPDCHAGEKQIAVTSTATVVTVNFSDIMGGVPVASVDGSDIVGIEWAFTKPEATAGTAGSGAGGASGGSGGASAGSGGKGGAAGSGTGGASGGSGGAPPAGSFDADITIDDVKFLGGPPAGGAGGAGGTGAGGASGGSGGASGGSGGASGGSGGKAGSGG